MVDDPIPDLALIGELSDAAIDALAALLIDAAAADETLPPPALAPALVETE